MHTLPPSYLRASIYALEKGASKQVGFCCCCWRKKEKDQSSGDPRCSSGVVQMEQSLFCWTKISYQEQNRERCTLSTVTCTFLLLGERHICIYLLPLSIIYQQPPPSSTVPIYRMLVVRRGKSRTIKTQPSLPDR
jgi:hypothetical protein